MILTRYKHDLHSKKERNSKSKEKSLINNQSFDQEFDDSHIVLRNTSLNIFRYSNYNKSFHEKI